MFLPLSVEIPIMATTAHSNQFTMSAATRDLDRGVFIPPLSNNENDPASQPLTNGFVDAAAVSQAVHELNEKFSSSREAPTANQSKTQAEAPPPSPQQLHVPVVVPTVHEYEGKTTPVIQDITPPTAKAENIELNSATTAKARHDDLKVTPAMEAYANDAATLPIHDASNTTTDYHNAGSMSSATRLKRRLLETDELIVCPGVYDGFSARIALSVGFTALYMTGAGTTASRLGMADLGVAQLHDMREHAEMIANLDPQGPPLIADMDTGYGGPIMVANSVQQYIRAGVAGFHIEDQVQTKRCGHLQGKKVVDIETFLSRIRAAKAAKDRANSDIVLIARTDANQQHGYDECITRLKAARAIGADVGLLEGFTSKEQARQAVVDLAPWPLLLNSVENGTSPLITVQEAQQMGFRIMIFSFASLAPAYGAIKAALEKLKTDGVTGTKKELTPKLLFEVCGLKDSMEVDSAAGGLAFAGGV